MSEFARTAAMRLLIVMLLALTVQASEAASDRLTLWNQDPVTHIFLFVDTPPGMSPVIEFSAMELKNDFLDWSVDRFDPSLAVLAGPEVQSGRGRLRLTFDYYLPQVAVQWAEVLYDSVAGSYVISGAGTLAVEAGSRPLSVVENPAFAAANARYIDDYFGNPPAVSSVPLPNSVVLTLSALAFLGFSRRPLRGASAARVAT